MSFSPIARIPLLLSALCLDAPLVAVGWAILLSNSKHLHPPTLAALFFAVWAIYLADRIRDSKTDSTPDGETVRHQFAEHHRGLMIALFILAILGGVFAALSGLQTETIVAGSGVATATSGYFVIIGWRNQNPSPRFLPVKEIAIALCFACGVKIGAGTPHFVEWLTWDTLALASLFLTNCLVISKAETSRDRSIDPHAFFATSSTRSELWIVAPALLTIVLGLYLAFTFCAGAGICLITCTAGLAWINRWPKKRASWVQAASDGVLILPWIAVALS